MLFLIFLETLPQIDNKYEIYDQKKEYADIQEELEYRIDILITYNSSSHLAQMNLLF